MSRAARAREPRTEQITLTVTPAMKESLEAEAIAEQRSLSDYVRWLLERRWMIANANDEWSGHSHATKATQP